MNAFAGIRFRTGALFLVRPAVHVCLCGESPLTAREGEGLATRQSQGGNKLMKEADSNLKVVERPHETLLGVGLSD